MSVQAMTRVMEQSEMRGVTRLVLLVIANHETEDRGAYPAIERLARECGTGVRTVQEAIRRAEKAGELKVAYRQGPHGTNLYRTLCGLGITARLPGTESTRIRTPQNPHPADLRRESAPERKELWVTGRSKRSPSSQPTYGFAEWYAAYPRHMQRRDAEKAYRDALKRTNGTTLLESAQRLAQDPNLPEKKLIPYPATWLRADAWLDDPYPSQARHTSKGNGKWADPAGPGMRTAKQFGLVGQT